MRRILLASLVLNGFFVVAFLWREAPVHAGGGDKPVGNGDVNGDGSIDITDAVYLLESLFLGGPAPKAIECPPTSGKGLPATGQTKCYGIEGWTVVFCDQAACPGQDGAYATGCPSEGRFVDNGDGTVTDTCTGLMWQKDTADVNGDGKIEWQDDPGADEPTWCDALAYCENLSFAGHDDWRLPNVRELESLVDYGRYRPAIDPVFSGVPSVYWSSTTFNVTSFIDYAYSVSHDVSTGVFVESKKCQRFVRAVRNAP